MKTWSRKEFLRASVIGGGAMLVASASARAAAAAATGRANGDIRVAVIGIRAQGAGHARTYYKMDGARLVGLCDVDRDVLAKNAADAEKAGLKVKQYTDFRKVLDDKEVDAIVIATPNHWHSLMTIMGLQAGKDVYVEKPLSHNIWEGRQAVAAAKKYSKNIVMAGTQNRSSVDIMEAIDYVRSGQMGAIKWARGLCYKKRDSIGRTEGPQKIPESIGQAGYDLWTGPADLKDPRRNGKFGSVHYDWHWFWNYGGGDISNQGIHQVDVARWFLGEPGLPPSVFSFGGRFGYQDDAETPNTLVSVMNYAKAPLIFEVRGLPMSSKVKDAMDNYRGSKVGVVIQCESGYLTVSENGTVNAFDNQNKKLKQFVKSTNGDHRKNFVKAMQDRKVVHGVIDEAHYSTALCHLANVSYLLGTEKANTAVGEAVRSSEPAKEAFGRMLDHLKANEVDTAATKSVVGPVLAIDGAKELFTGGDATVTAAANNHFLRKRAGRGSFTIPQLAST